jgi:hypothetical protein
MTPAAQLTAKGFAVRLRARVLLIAAPMPPIRRTVCLAAIALSVAACEQRADEDPANQYHRYSNTELEAVCERMSPSLYISGMTDSAWVVLLPGMGRTHYVRSACYMELVRRTGRSALCPKVVERRSLLGDGSAYTPQSCERVAQQFKARQAQNEQDAAAHAQALQGVFRMGLLTANVLPDGSWRLQAAVEGSRAGSYRVEIDDSRRRQRLLTQPLVLSQNQSLQWDIARREVVGDTPLPNIFPIAVSLFYLPGGGEEGRRVEHLVSVRNITLSAQ